MSRECLLKRVTTGEASVSYLSSCEAPARLAVYASAMRIKPKIIVLLRNPVKILVFLSLCSSSHSLVKMSAINLLNYFHVDI